MPSEFDYVEAPTEGEVDKWGFSIKPTITDIAATLICLRNAPCGTDKKQIERLITHYEIMGKKSFKNKHAQEWTWEETPETIEALKKLHDTQRRANMKEQDDAAGYDTGSK